MATNLTPFSVPTYKSGDELEDLQGTIQTSMYDDIFLLIKICVRILISEYRFSLHTWIVTNYAILK